jgi:hypothetical protein
MKPKSKKQSAVLQVIPDWTADNNAHNQEDKKLLMKSEGSGGTK